MDFDDNNFIIRNIGKKNYTQINFTRTHCFRSVFVFSSLSCGEILIIKWDGFMVETRNFHELNIQKKILKTQIEWNTDKKINWLVLGVVICR